jgi:hypothetical protein
MGSSYLLVRPTLLALAVVQPEVPVAATVPVAAECQWRVFALLCFAFIAFPSETHT